MKYQPLGGYVTSTESFSKNQRKILADGLFSEQIFGPINSYCCSCGKYNIRKFAGQVCPSCGVLCDSNELRYSTFGKILLTFPIIKPNRKNKFLKLIGTENKNLINPERADYLSSTHHYLAIKYNKKQIKIVKHLNNDNGFLTIPFRITGIYSLYLVLSFLKSYFDIEIVNKIFEDEYITNYLYVIPPNLRMISFESKTNRMRTPHINKYYTAILRYNKKDQFLLTNLRNDEESWHSKIAVALKNKFLDQDIVESTVIEYDLKSSKYQYYANKIYSFVSDKLSGKYGLIRNSILGKVIEFSARTVIRSEPSLPPYQIKVSKTILKKLWSPYFLFYLTSILGMDYDYCYDEMLLNEINNNKFNEYFEKFLDWFMTKTENDPFDKQLSRLMFLNRQPTLWRHGISAVEAIPEDGDNDTIGLSPLILEQYNADFDGDSVALYVIHDIEALKEMKEKASVRNIIMSDSDQSMLSVIRHESLYAAYILTEKTEFTPEMLKEPGIFDSLDDVPITFDLLNDHLNYPVKIGNDIYKYGICVFNKFCGFKEVIINKEITKNESNNLSYIIYEYFGYDNNIYYDKMTNLNKNLLFFISATNHSPTINIDEMVNILTDDDSKLFQKLPDNNVELGYLINESLIDRCIDHLDKNYTIYKLFRSGSRFNKQQFARSCINIGYTADDNNIIVPKPIKTNLLKGLTAEDFFLGSPGSRKGIGDKSDETPKSGYMERTLTMALSPLELEEEDCHTQSYLDILVINDKHANTLVSKYFIDPLKFPINELNDLDDKWELITKKNKKDIIGKKILLRSPIICQTPNFKMCKKCFGERYYPTRYIGITAAQCLSERLTQLIMR